MTDELIDRYTKRHASRHEPEVQEAEESATDLGAFGWLRGARSKSVSLELRKLDGRILAIPYSWISRMTFDPESGITLHTAGNDITIEGWNLNTEVRPTVRLFEGLTRHRVTWIAETSRRDPSLPNAAETSVSQIVWLLPERQRLETAAQTDSDLTP